ncbi:MAG TPA: methyltransferase [Chitinophagaceae bacterium]|nr:methyltransferase [Chitinophagaceae bacterium]
MANNYFRFKQFTVHQELAAMKVTTDACLFGAWAAKNIAASTKGNDILDIGTGTGLLSLMIAQQVNAQIDAIEIDKAAAEQAEKNAANSPWKDCIHILHGDARVFDFNKQYDTIISNPPFYENELSSADMLKNTAHHDAGLLISELLSIISRQLKDDGRFYLLLPFKRYEEIKAAIPKYGMKLGIVCLAKQSRAHSFFRVLVAGGKKEEIIEMEELAIKENLRDYTAEFSWLLKEYYLYL